MKLVLETSGMAFSNYFGFKVLIVPVLYSVHILVSGCYLGSLFSLSSLLRTASSVSSLYDSLSWTDKSSSSRIDWSVAACSSNIDFFHA